MKIEIRPKLVDIPNVLADCTITRITFQKLYVLCLNVRSVDLSCQRPK